ncbi:MAG: DNA alkylation repair protein [Ignavibacteriales bacterium]|nr:DNA alkylation repair protein [Ignavibacteriales bacterium]
MTTKQIIAELKKNGNEHNRKGMARFGINVDKAFGVNVPVMRALAKVIGKNHELAIELWKSGYHEARHVAAMIDDPKLVTKAQMNKWVCDFNSWDICDGTCSNLFRKTPYAIEKIFEWCEKKDEYIRRAGFSLMCYVAVHHKTRDDEEFLEFFPLIKKYSVDERNFVKKAVNWALRQIGKRSRFLNEEALKVAKEIHALDSKSAKWIASDAIRELTDPKILARIKR